MPSQIHGSLTVKTQEPLGITPRAWPSRVIPSLVLLINVFFELRPPTQGSTGGGSHDYPRQGNPCMLHLKLPLSHDRGLREHNKCHEGFSLLHR